MYFGAADPRRGFPDFRLGWYSGSEIVLSNVPEAIGCVTRATACVHQDSIFDVVVMIEW